ncbi:hypothetical protein R0381_002948 [Jeongeupia wiesaeckerbachi]|uniref:hypothetical protein n=1 Tax=Jeongeupia wiesaeckerbachi TaxID=3051218 RepID=UPI003D80563B
MALKSGGRSKGAAGNEHGRINDMYVRFGGGLARQTKVQRRDEQDRVIDTAYRVKPAGSTIIAAALTRKIRDQLKRFTPLPSTWKSDEEKATD